MPMTLATIRRNALHSLIPAAAPSIVGMDRRQHPSIDLVGFGAFLARANLLFSAHDFAALSSSRNAAHGIATMPCRLVFSRIVARDLGNGLVSASNIEFIEQHRSG